MYKRNKREWNEFSFVPFLFGISYDSAKRDLRLLEEQGLLKRTHGGAIPMQKVGYRSGIGNLTTKERVTEIRPYYLSIADALHQNENITLLMLGGEVKTNGNVYDSFAIEMAKRRV